MIYLLDTNIISALMKSAIQEEGRRVAQRIAAAAPGWRLTTSIVVQCELLYGLRRRSSERLLRRYDEVMELLEVLPLDIGVAPHYASLRQGLEAMGRPIGFNDSFIAAHAIALDATLVSADAEFTRVPGLKLENWLT